jgi:hypothetical protein
LIKPIVIVLFLFCLASLSALVFHGYSTYFTLDTINPTVNLLSPDGGENWVAGQSGYISWTAFDTNLGDNSIQVQFSMDGGLNWQSIGSFQPALGQMEWLVPALQSDCALVRIIMHDTFGNVGQDESGSCFSLISPMPASPQDVRISLYHDTDVYVSWSAVITDIYGNPFIPDGYLVLCSDNPSDAGQFSLLTVTPNTDYIHLNAAAYISRMFYCIIAYQGELPTRFELNNPNNRLNTQHKTSK